jgi:FkbM family methyltransferase
VLARLAHALLGAVPAGLTGRSRTLRGAAPVVEWLVALVGRPLEGKSVVIPRGEGRGAAFRAERRSLAWITGKVEPEVQSALGRLLRPGDTFLDVGASIGFYTILGGRLVGAAGRVIAFEPSPDAAAAARVNAGLNGLEDVLVLEAALSDTDGEAFLERLGQPTATLVEEPSTTTVRVPTTTLDAFLAAHPDLTPTVVKIDVEGHEAAVLRGMRSTLAHVRPTVIVEMHGDRGFLATLEEAGYTSTVLERYASVAEAPWWAHVLGTPPDATGR